MHRHTYYTYTKRKNSSDVQNSCKCLKLSIVSIKFYYYWISSGFAISMTSVWGNVDIFKSTRKSNDFPINSKLDFDFILKLRVKNRIKIYHFHLTNFRKNIQFSLLDQVFSCRYYRCKP